MNDQEEAVYKALTRRGFEVLRNGWPDFLVLDKDWKRGFALEMKRGGDRVSPAQARMHKALARFGISVQVAREDFTRAVRRNGRKLLLPEDLSKLEWDLASMKRSQWELNSRVEGLEKSLSEATVLFEGDDINAPWPPKAA